MLNRATVLILSAALAASPAVAQTPSPCDTQAVAQALEHHEKYEAMLKKQVEWYQQQTKVSMNGVFALAILTGKYLNKVCGSPAKCAKARAEAVATEESAMMPPLPKGQPSVISTGKSLIAAILTILGQLEPADGRAEMERIGRIFLELANAVSSP